MAGRPFYVIVGGNLRQAVPVGGDFGTLIGVSQSGFTLRYDQTAQGRFVIADGGTLSPVYVDEITSPSDWQFRLGSLNRTTSSGALVSVPGAWFQPPIGGTGFTAYCEIKAPAIRPAYVPASGFFTKLLWAGMIKTLGTPLGDGTSNHACDGVYYYLYGGNSGLSIACTATDGTLALMWPAFGGGSYTYRVYRITSTGPLRIYDGIGFSTTDIPGTPFPVSYILHITTNTPGDNLGDILVGASPVTTILSCDAPITPVGASRVCIIGPSATRSCFVQTPGITRKDIGV